MFLSKNDYLLSDGQNTIICKTNNVRVRASRASPAGLVSLHPLKNNNNLLLFLWGVGARG